MKILVPDPTVPKEADSKDLGEFFNSDACTLLRKVASSRIADESSRCIEALTDNAEGFLSANKESIGMSDSMTEIARYSIFLNVLDRIEADLKNQKDFVIVEKLNVV